MEIPAEAPGRPDFCAVCEAILEPDPSASYFDRLGLSPRFGYALDELSERHRAQLRVFHPDRFHGEGQEAWRWAVAHATAINDALRTLADPQHRLEYLLTLHGAELPTVTLDPSGMTAMAPIHRVEMAELDTALAELDGVDAHTERTSIGRRVARRYAQELERVGSRLDHALDEEALDGQAQFWLAAISRLRSLRHLLEHLDAEFPFGATAP